MQQVGCLAESLWWSGSSHHDEMHLYFISLCAVTSQLLAKAHQASLAESSGHEAWFIIFGSWFAWEASVHFFFKGSVFYTLVIFICSLKYTNNVSRGILDQIGRTLHGRFQVLSGRKILFLVVLDFLKTKRFIRKIMLNYFSLSINESVVNTQ